MDYTPFLQAQRDHQHQHAQHLQHQQQAQQQASHAHHLAPLPYMPGYDLPMSLDSPREGYSHGGGQGYGACNGTGTGSGGMHRAAFNDSAYGVDGPKDALESDLHAAMGGGEYREGEEEYYLELLRMGGQGEAGE